MGAGFNRWVQQVGCLLEFVAMLISWVVFHFVGVCPGEVPALFVLF